MYTKLLPLIVSTALAGCYGGTVAYTSPSGTVAYSSPDMAYVSPGVQVIADYDVPIFYSSGFYWTNYNGRWYRSTQYTGGWGYVAAPPYAITAIRSPYAYRYYRPYGYVPRYRPVPSYRGTYPGYYGSSRYRYESDRYRSDRYDQSRRYQYDRDTYNRQQYERNRQQYERQYDRARQQQYQRNRQQQQQQYDRDRAARQRSGSYQQRR